MLEVREIPLGNQVSSFDSRFDFTLAEGMICLLSNARIGCGFGYCYCWRIYRSACGLLMVGAMIVWKGFLLK